MLRCFYKQLFIYWSDHILYMGQTTKMLCMFVRLFVLHLLNCGQKSNFTIQQDRRISLIGMARDPSVISAVPPILHNCNYVESGALH